MTSVLSSLKPDLTLMNSNFETYKLSLQKLSVDEQQLHEEVFTKTLNYKEYSLQHIKAYGIHNNLILDPWNYQDAYFITSDLKIMKVSVNDFGKMDMCTSVFSIPQSSSIVEHHNPCLEFASKTMACISDGTGNLIFVDTGCRTNSETTIIWEVIFIERPLEDVPFLLKCVHAHDEDNVPPNKIDCIVLSVHEVSVEQSNNLKKNSFNTHLNWFTYAAGESGLTLSRHRRLVGQSVPDYLSLDHDAQHLYICSETPFHFLYDSVKPVQAGPSGDETNGHTSSDNDVNYKWKQDQNEVILELPISESDVKVDDIRLTLSGRVLTITLNECTLFSAELYKDIDQEKVEKRIVDNKLEITLIKTESSSELWPSLLGSGMSSEEASKVRKEMNEAVIPEDHNPAYNVEQLEECDAAPENESCLYRIDGESKNITHQVNLGADQFLFSVQLQSVGSVCLCLRHDVDALVWEPVPPYTMKIRGGEPESTCWRHIVTFCALGYVAASKEDRKYSTCSPNASFAVLCDASRRLFIYEQPKPLSGDGQLRNRKTGKCVSDVAAQRVVTLSSSSQIEGCRANNHGIFVITKDTLFFIQMPESLDE